MKTVCNASNIYRQIKQNGIKENLYEVKSSEIRTNQIKNTLFTKYFNFENSTDIGHLKIGNKVTGSILCHNLLKNRFA